MFIAVDNGILNMKRVTTVEIDRDTPSEINYLFNDGGIIKEKFDSEENAQTKFDELAENTIFLQTNDKRLVNSMYIKDVEKDFINNKRLVYVLYNGAPVKETYNSETEVDSALETLKSTLESMGEGGGEGGSVDLTPYLKKTDAASTYVPKTELVNLATKAEVGLKADKTYVDTELEKKANATAIPTTTSQLTNNSDFTTKAYVDGLVGDVESLLGGI